MLGLALVGGPSTISPKVVAISMFKNGFALVRREVAITTPGEAFLDRIPVASLGTLWFVGDDALKLEAVENVVQTTKERAELGTLDEILRANVGKLVNVGVITDGKVQDVRGTLVSATNQLVVIKGEIDLAVPKPSIVRISADSGKLVYDQEVSSAKRALRVRTKGTGTLSIVSLERGTTWSPSYALKLDQNQRLQVTLKSTILNDLEDLDKVNAKLITGFPNVPYAQWLDPLVSGYSTDDFLRMVNQLDNAGGMPGGFGGGQSRGNLMTQNAIAPMDSFQFTGPGFVPAAGEQLEDLFLYTIPNLTLNKGERAYKVVTDFSTSYSDLYSWEIDTNSTDNLRLLVPASEKPETVNHLIRFKNTGGSPFTTGVATLYRDNQIVGQDQMKYVPAGVEAEVKLNQALDVVAKISESEISREVSVRKRYDGLPLYDRITVKVDLTVTNTRRDAAAMRIRRRFAGELETPAKTIEAETRKLVQGERQPNPVTEIIFKPKVESGKTWNLSYQYRMLVPSGQGE